jgi:putative adenylate-forming enzyme
MSDRNLPDDDITRASLDWWSTFARMCEIAWTRQCGREAIAAAAAKRAADIIRFAREHSRFYRDAWSRLPADHVALERLPVVHKRDLMARFDHWVTDRSVTRRGIDAFLRNKTHVGWRFLDRYVVWKSSGSTGDPGIYVQDAFALTTYDALLAVQIHAGTLAGPYAHGVLAQGGRAALVAATGDHFASVASWQRLCRGREWPVSRVLSVMDPLEKIVAELNAFQPAFLASYPTTLVLLASEQREGRLRIAPTCVWSGGECLAPAAAASIEHAFGSVLVNEYGASECMSIGFSCRTGWLHVNADWAVLEAVDRDHQPTPAGERSHTVLLTNLANRVQPIIRYDLGDSVIVNPEPCACGNPLPAIRVEGRRDDVLALRARDGHVVRLSPLALTTVVEDATAGRRFQLVQTGPDLIAVRLEAREARVRDAQWHAAQQALHDYLTLQSLENVRLSLAVEPPVVDLRSGKLREVIAADHA